LVEEHEADVVAGLLILPAGVAQPDNQRNSHAAKHPIGELSANHFENKKAPVAFLPGRLEMVLNS
jgi:hypothetical protein